MNLRFYQLRRLLSIQVPPRIYNVLQPFSAHSIWLKSPLPADREVRFLNFPAVNECLALLIPLPDVGLEVIDALVATQKHEILVLSRKVRLTEVT
jgi:hypothetical protein